MKNNRITCPHCGEDITESVNHAVASRAARAWHEKHDNEYYRELVKKRWAKKKAAEGIKTRGTQVKDDTPPLRRRTTLYGVLNCGMRVVVVLE